MNQDEEWQYAIAQIVRLEARVALLEEQARRVEDVGHVHISRTTLRLQSQLLHFLHLRAPAPHGYFFDIATQILLTAFAVPALPPPLEGNYDPAIIAGYQRKHFPCDRRSEDGHATDYMNWMQYFIHSFGFAQLVVDIHDRAQTLSVQDRDANGSLVLPISLHGTSDMLIQAASEDVDLNQAVIVCQVKKDVTSSQYNKFIAQSTAELIALETKTPNKSLPTFGLLTDLGNSWTFL